MSTIAEEFAAIAAEQGYDGPTPTTIAGAVDALTTALGGEPSGGTIAQAVHALAPNIGGGGSDAYLIPMSTAINFCNVTLTDSVFAGNCANGQKNATNITLDYDKSNGYASEPVWDESSSTWTGEALSGYANITQMKNLPSGVWGVATIKSSQTDTIAKSIVQNLRNGNAVKYAIGWYVPYGISYWATEIGELSSSHIHVLSNGDVSIAFPVPLYDIRQSDASLKGNKFPTSFLAVAVSE